MSQNLHDCLTLFSVPGLGPAAFAVLLQRFQTPAEVLRATRTDLREVAGIGRETAQAILDKRDEKWADEQIAQASEAGVDILTMDDGRYPPLLRQIYAPPPVLFVRGTVDVCARPAVALVGSRAFTHYGRDTACRLAAELVQRGITVVSGMAMGIDTHAHRGALEQGGYTAAVLGSGLDHPYPAENAGLFDDICRTGVVVTEFPLGTSPEPHNFPRRNRVISGLSLGVVVIEAGTRSGALLTAQHAVEQGREVFAVPGPIHSGKSTGTNRLIKEGAVLIQSVDDILNELPNTLGQPFAQPSGVSSGPQDTPTEADLSDEERAVLAHLSVDTPQHVDAIAAHSGLPASQTLSVLLSLELAGRVQQRPGKQFIRKAP